MSLQESSSTSNTGDTDGAGAHGGSSEIANGRPVAARLIIAAGLVMYFAMMGLILFRWLTLKEPNSLLRLHGVESDNGVVVEVSDVGEHPQPHAPVILGPENEYIASFPLPPGTYRVRMRRGDKIIGDGEVTLREATFRDPDPPPLDISILHRASSATQPGLPSRS
jgi:hypothetical protein